MLRLQSVMLRAVRAVPCRCAIVVLALASAACVSASSVGTAPPGDGPLEPPELRADRSAAAGSSESEGAASSESSARPAEIATWQEPALPDGREATSEALPDAEARVRGRSTVVVEAPLERVRATVLDFDAYAAFMPHYRTSHVLLRTAESTQVYMQVAALGGLVKMGAKVTFPRAARDAGGWQTYESHFDGGSARDFRAIWRMRAKDDARTLLSLEVFLLPRLPLPTGTLNDENTNGAREGVEAMRRRIEGM
ncbi:MAG: hypothetical protein FJ096_07865 [Deltaproteobacteria bacterium]|nr:hypothetical protein [Deltaproteobacteria bacterium]